MRRLLLVFSFMMLWVPVGCKTTSSTKPPIYLIKVERGDTLAKIAHKYDTSWQSIIALNDLGHAAQLRIGQVLRVRPGEAGRVADELEPMNPRENTQRAQKLDFEGEGADDKAKKGGLLFGDEKAYLHWPVEGSVSSVYGPRHSRFHHGIDIRAHKGAAVKAAAAGSVEFAGRKRGYGKTVIINHGDFKTLYAHCSAISVERGQRINIGKVIGAVGMTGNASGPHLHFEVRKLSGSSVDPLQHFARGELLSQLSAE